MKTFLGTALALLLSGTIAAQPQPLTNADIVRLVTAHVPTDMVVRMVASSPVDFDISMAALAVLQQDGVPDIVLRAMVARIRPPKTADGTEIEMPAAPQPGVGSVSFVHGSARIELLRASPALAQSGGTASLLLNPFAKPGLVELFVGGQAPTRIALAMPVFQVELPAYLEPGESIALVKLAARADRRELPVRAADARMPRDLDDDAVVPIRVALVEDEAFRAGALRKYQVDVVTPLDAGEYALVLHDGLFYDFGIEGQ